MLMGMYGKLLRKLPSRVINGECSEELGPLLIRYYLIGNMTSKYGIYIHHLLRSDIRTMHDHPWSFISFILKGEYIEHHRAYITGILGRTGFKENKKLYKRFSILIRPARWIHRLEMSSPCWTLVIRFKKTKTWGFFTPQGFVNWKVYNYDGDCSE